MRLPGLGGWSEDPLWASVYDWTVEHPRAGGALWAIGIQSDLRLLHRAAEEISTLAPGSRVLDVPCGGGVALRGLPQGLDVDYVAVDIASTMLRRTERAAERRGVTSSVRTVLADVGALPFDTGSFDLVLSFTGLHCFPDPALATRELARVLRPGGVISLSALLEDSGRHHAPLRFVGRRAGLLGPGCTGPEVLSWLAAGGVPDATLTRSGAIAYVRGVKN
jgi:SAM-dependent methyltransferase